MMDENYVPPEKNSYAHKLKGGYNNYQPLSSYNYSYDYEEPDLFRDLGNYVTEASKQIN